MEDDTELKILEKVKELRALGVNINLDVKEVTQEMIDEQNSPKANKSVVDRAEETAKKLEEVSTKYEGLLRELDERKAKEILGGKTEAGQIAPQPKEMSDVEYANAFFRGEIKPKE